VIYGTKITAVCVVVGAAALAASCSGGSKTVDEKPDNGRDIASVLLITIDTLRADHLGVYGADLSTPNLDALAARGVRFTNARSHIPITGPSHSSLFTSLLPMEHGVLNNGNKLSDRFPTMAEALGASGRQTAAVISLGVMKKRWGFDRGFDHFGGRFERDWMKDGAEVTDEVLALSDDSLGHPYFLWAHYSDPHEPYAPPGLDYPGIELRLNGRVLGRIDAGGRGNRINLELPPGESKLELVPLDVEPDRIYVFKKMLVRDPSIEIKPIGSWRLTKKPSGRTQFRGKLPAIVQLANRSAGSVETDLVLACKQVLSMPEIRRRYALEVEFADREIGRLLAGLEARRLMDDTLVVITSDHGEGLGDHDLVGHISQLYDSLLHVPLVFAWPGELPAGAVVDFPASLIDVFPTIAELLGAEVPPDGSGISLVPVMWGGDLQARPVHLATFRPQSPHDKRGLVIDGHKYIHSWTDERDWEELYDLGEDSGELEDLAGGDPELLGRIRTEMERRLAEMVESPRLETELSDEEKANLTALGYLSEGP
jgi:arylsulfatase A-like enzyme